MFLRGHAEATHILRQCPCLIETRGAYPPSGLWLPLPGECTRPLRYECSGMCLIGFMLQQPQDWCALSQRHSELAGDQKKLSGFDDRARNVIPCLEGFQRHMKSFGDLF